MILVDTSVWINHLRAGHRGLSALLNNAEVLCHPLVIGELACGNLKNRKMVLSLLQALPTAEIIEYQEILPFIETHKLMGLGLGYIDIHLLASAFLSHAQLLTLDRKLSQTASRFHLMYSE
jgi:predicted nucleic acid-binding protein